MALVAVGLDARLHAPLISTGIGIVAVLLGVLVIGTADSGEADALRTLPALDARALGPRSAGEAVLIEGRIASHPVIEGGLVALQRQRAVGAYKPGTNEVRFTWETESVALPTVFTLDVLGGAVTLMANDFSWREVPRIVDQPSVVTAGSRRLAGFAAGDAVTVDGTVAAGAHGASSGAADGARTLKAQRLHGGDVAAYRAARSAGVHALPMIGAIFTALGLAVLALGGVLLRRALGTPSAAQGEPA